jgi:hypothetical protein
METGGLGVNLSKRNRDAIALCLRKWANLDIETGAAKEAAGVKLDDHAMCLDIAEKRIRHIELLLLNPKPILKRYDPIQRLDQGGCGVGEMAECPDGEFVRYLDIAGGEVLP